MSFGVKPGGIYVVEDLHTNYWLYFRTSAVSFVDVLKYLMDEIHRPYFHHDSEAFFRQAGPSQIKRMKVSRASLLIESIEIADSIAAIVKRTDAGLPTSQLNVVDQHEER